MILIGHCHVFGHIDSALRGLSTELLCHTHVSSNKFECIPMPAEAVQGMYDLISFHSDPEEVTKCIDSSMRESCGLSFPVSPHIVLMLMLGTNYL